MTVCKDLTFKAREHAEALIKAAASLCPDADGGFSASGIDLSGLPEFVVEIPADTSHGDFASNAAMVWSKALKSNPRKIAEALVSRMDFSGSDCFFERAEVAGPGFINFFLSRQWFNDVLYSIMELGGAYGHTNYGMGEKVMIEFISANPTGPMHMGNARGGAIGDCLSSVMEAAGYDISREFYINDSGNQIEKFGLSLEARYLQIFLGEDTVPFPEDGYQGDDIKERAKEYADVFGDNLVNASSEERQNALVKYVLPRNINDMREGLSDYRIEYKTWFHESSLYKDGSVDAVLEELKNRGLTYEKDGALWYKATVAGGEKDEVLVRQNGNATYFAADIAYHYNKFSVRGFSRVIDVWGADHHGHVARLKGAMDAIGLDGSKLDIILMQLVRLVKDGEPYKMSKRTGRSVTLSDLLGLVPVDAARFFFNLTSPNTSMDFDLDLAVKQSGDNPVYYVQYAHARICSILKKLSETGVSPRECTADELALLSSPDEIELIRLLAKYPSMIVNAAVNYDPARITRYAIDAATQFHKFYTNCRVAGDDEALTQARLCLCECAKTTIANALSLLKISAPESM